MKASTTCRRMRGPGGDALVSRSAAEFTLFDCPDDEAATAHLDAWDASIFGAAERAIATIAVRGNAVVGDSPVESWLAEHGIGGFGIDE